MDPISPDLVLGTPGVVLTSVTLDGIVDWRGNTPGTLRAYLDPQPGGASVGPQTVSYSPVDGSFELTRVLSGGRWKVRLAVTAGELVRAVSSQEFVIVRAVGVIRLPLPL